MADALEEWLSSAPIVTNADGISWWNAMDQTGHPMARMALNFLSIPGNRSTIVNILFYNYFSSNIYRRRAGIFMGWVDSFEDAAFSL